MSHLVSRLVSAACLIAALGACAAEEDLGTVDLNLVGQAPSGAVYVLRHADITVTSAGGSTQVFHTDDNVEATRISAEVLTGSYTALVAPGWQLLRRTAAGETPVDATLISPNPTTFDVAANASTSVVLRFSVLGENVPLDRGSFDISVEVEERHLTTIGNAEPLAGTETWSGGYVFALSVDVAAPVRLRKLGHIGAGSGTQPNCRFGLYESVADAPGALITQTGTVVPQVDRGEIDVPVVVLPAGRYWLATHCDANVTFRSAPDSYTTIFRYVDREPGAALPEPFPAGPSTYFGRALNLYLVVETL